MEGPLLQFLIRIGRTPGWSPANPVPACGGSTPAPAPVPCSAIRSPLAHQRSSRKRTRSARSRPPPTPSASATATGTPAGMPKAHAHAAPLCSPRSRFESSLEPLPQSLAGWSGGRGCEVLNILNGGFDRDKFGSRKVAKGVDLRHLREWEDTTGRLRRRGRCVQSHRRL